MIVLLSKKPSPFLFETLEDILEARDVKIIVFKVSNIAKRVALIWKDVFLCSYSSCDYTLSMSFLEHVSTT